MSEDARHEPDGPSEVAAAVAALREGQLVGLPTDTVYGLAADATDPEAVARIFAAKGRPPGRPLPVLLPSLDHLARWSSPLPPEARALAERFWPGPLTLVVPRSPLAQDVVTGGLETIGLRVPAHPMALAVLEAFGGGLATPSANRHGEISPTTAGAVRRQLGPSVAVVVDGGPCALGVESTVVALDGAAPRILRVGALGRAALEEALGRPMTGSDPRLSTRFRLTTPVELVERAQLSARRSALHAEGADVQVVEPGPDLYERLAVADASGHDRLLVVAPQDVASADALRERLGQSST